MIFRYNFRTMAFSLAALIVAVDQLTKQWARSYLEQPGVTLALSGPINLTLVLNRSNAFGLVPIAGEFTRWGLTILGFAVAASLGVAIIRGGYRRLTVIGLAFIIAGALGNAIDRARYGAVIDLIDASKIGFVWVFNIADMALDVGLGFIILGWLFPGPGGEDSRYGSSALRP
jgi:signal peptidase II